MVHYRRVFFEPEDGLDARSRGGFFLRETSAGPQGNEVVCLAQEQDFAQTFVWMSRRQYQNGLGLIDAGKIVKVGIGTERVFEVAGTAQDIGGVDDSNCLLTDSLTETLTVLGVEFWREGLISHNV